MQANGGTMEKDIISLMKQKQPKMSKSHKVIANYIMDNYEQAVFMTAAQLGKTVGISESTVVRFAASLGYDGYPEFQKALEEWVKNRLTGVQRVNVKYEGSSQSDVITSVLNADIDKIAHTIEHLDVQSFETAIELILNARHVYVIGLRSCEPLADFLNFYLSMIREDVQLVRTTSMTELFEQMLHVDDRDCVIGISFPRYSMRTLKAMEFAKDRNAKVVCITDSEHSPMKLYATVSLLARSDMVSIVDSLVAPLSLINALVVAMCLQRPQQVHNNLKMLEQAWGDYQVYLNDEINFINDEPMLNNSLRKEEDA